MRTCRTFHADCHAIISLVTDCPVIMVQLAPRSLAWHSCHARELSAPEQNATPRTSYRSHYVHVISHR
jgi:hypothetical protein